VENKNIGLIDIDGKKFPNLALMKISAYHKSIGDNVEFATMFEHYDIIYKSKLFSWTVDPEYCYNTKKYIIGGSGFNYKTTLSNKINAMMPDYRLYNCTSAYGYLTRGCIRKCDWCIVPEAEGDIRPEHDIEQIIGNMTSVILMDNNVLAHEWGIKQIEKIINKKIKIDFNQGLDARLIDNSISKLLARVKWLKPLRLACDKKEAFKDVEKAVKLLRKYNATPSKYFCYVLVKNISDSHEQIKKLRALNIDPFAQPYRDKKNTPVPYENKRFCRWVNHKAIFKSIEWEEYRDGKQEQQRTG